MQMQYPDINRHRNASESIYTRVLFFCLPESSAAYNIPRIRSSKAVRAALAPSPIEIMICL